MSSELFKLKAEELVSSISSGHYVIVHRKSLVAPRGRPDLQCEDIAVTFSTGETVTTKSVLKGCWNRTDVVCDWSPSTLSLEDIHTTFDKVSIVSVMDLRGHLLLKHPRIKLVLE